MGADARARNCHDALVHNVFGRREAFAAELRRLLPRELLPHVDFASLRRAPTRQTDAALRELRPDLHFIVDLVDGDARVPVHLPVEHQSTPEPRMPKRAHGYVGGIWDDYIHDHPEDRATLPFVLPILLTQHPARNTPTQLSSLFVLSPSLRRLLGTPIELTLLVDDFSGSIMGDTETPLPTRALVEITRALLHAYKNPDALTEQRIAELAPLFDILVQSHPDDVRMLWVYVVSAFETGSPLRAMILKAVSKQTKEEYMTYADELLAQGEARGLAKSLLRVLERRAITISEAVRERVLATRDGSLLQRWFDRAFSVASADELFEAAEAG